MRVCIEVANVRCGGCANTITKALLEQGFEEVTVDLSLTPRRVSAWARDEAHEELFYKALRTLGYPPAHEAHSMGEEMVFKAKSFVSCAVGKFD